MAKLPFIELSNGVRIPILHEDRNIIAVDKPQGWMLAPVSWQNTGRNLFAALTSSVNAGDFWAKSRSLKFIRFVHRLDADTSGVLLLVKAPGAMPAFTELFEDRKVEKVYLAVVAGVPEVNEWTCRLRLAPMPERPGRMEVNNTQGKDTETLFRVVEKGADRTLLMCWPLTGRTHQIRLHLAAIGHPVLADDLYGNLQGKPEDKLALRAVRLSYRDPFMAQPVKIEADMTEFVKLHGFDPASEALHDQTAPDKALEHPKGRLDEAKRAAKEERDEERSRRNWQEDDDSGGFASETGVLPDASAHTPQQFSSGPRGESRGTHRKFEGRSGGFNRKPGGYAGGGRGFTPRSEGQRDFGNRPPARPGYGPKSFGGPRSEGRPFGGPRKPSGDVDGNVAERPRSFGNRGGRDERGGSGYRSGPGGNSGYGRPYEARGERRPFGGGGGFNRDRGDAGESRPGVFRSSAQGGLQSGFQKSGGFGPRSGGQPFRSSSQGRPFSSGSEGRPFRPGGEGRPDRAGGGNRPFRGGGEGRPFRPSGEGRPFRGGGESRPSGSGEWRGDGPRASGRPPGKFGRAKPAGRPFKKF